MGYVKDRLDILLVEDNSAAARLAVEACREAMLLGSMTVVGTGEEALELLRQSGGFTAAPHPDMVLLDLDLPTKSGKEVLAEIKRDPKLRKIPVMVLSASMKAEDITDTYDLHANAYITKPAALDDFIRVLRAVEDFWCAVASLPGKAGCADGPTEGR